MDSILKWGIEIITAIQQVHGPILDNVFDGITFMGEEEFYLLLLPLIFWCVDFDLGVRLAILFLISSWLNINLKDLLQQPRPFELDQSVMLSSASGYGLPSNHAQSAVIVWGSIAHWARKTWIWIAAVSLMILIGFSRVYLGVHFPTDVLAGWLVGFILLVIFLASESAIGDKVRKFDLWLQLFLALAVAVGLFLIHPVNATANTMGTLAGLGIGLALTERYFSFKAYGVWWHRVIRFVIGSIIVLFVYVGLKSVSPVEESELYMVFRFLRYSLIGVWVSLGAPWLFQKFKLAFRSVRTPKSQS